MEGSPDFVVPQDFANAVDLVPVSFSYATLVRTADHLGEQARLISESGDWGITVGIMPQHNRVLLQVPPPGERSAAVAGFLLTAEAAYPGMLRIEELAEPPSVDACTTSGLPYCDPPLRSGIAINYGSAGCSGGFPARSRSDGKLYLMTAGHCARHRTANDWTTRFPSQSVHAIGRVHRCQAGRGPSNNCAQGDGDMAILRVNNPAGWQNGRGWVFVRPSPGNGGIPGTTRDEDYPIRRTGKTGEPLKGFRVCKSGRVSTSCGEVVAVAVRSTIDDYSYAGMAAATYHRDQGDSGGPVYANGTAYGLHHGASGSFGLYQGITAAQNVLNVDILVVE